jgi:hypothetical protein
VIPYPRGYKLGNKLVLTEYRDQRNSPPS